MEVHILRNILLICVLLLVCVQLSFQQRDYYNEYDDIDDGLTPAPRTRPDRRRTSSRTRGRDKERRERESEREREVERRERERERARERARELERRERERQRSRQRVLYTTPQGLLPPPTEETFTSPPQISTGRTDSCGCPTNIEYSINSLNNYVKTSTSDKAQTMDRLGKIEKQLQDLQELVERVDAESQNWKNSLRFPGLSVLNSPTSIALSDDAPRSTDTFKGNLKRTYVYKCK